MVLAENVIAKYGSHCICLCLACLLKILMFEMKTGSSYIIKTKTAELFVVIIKSICLQLLHSSALYKKKIIKNRN